MPDPKLGASVGQERGARVFAAAVVTLIAWIWPEPGGRAWEPAIVSALTYILLEIGTYTARWLPKGPGARVR